MQILVPQYQRNPNEKVWSLYNGVAPGGRTVTTLVKPSLDRNRLEATRVYGEPLPRGQGGRIGVLVLGGMETSLDEVEYILQARREKKFVPQRNQSEIAAMCRVVQERRNELIREHRKLKPASRPPSKPRKVLYLPKGVRWAQTEVPGLKVLARA